MLRADEIRSLKQHILEQSRAANGGEPSNSNSKPPSTYVAVSSLAWTSVVRAKPSIHDTDDVQHMVSADCSSRIRPPLGDAFLGTASSRASLVPGAAALARGAAAIRGAIRAQLEELGGDQPSDAESWIAAYRAVPQERSVAVGSSNRFMAYETDFGWGAPTRVELVSLFARQMVTPLGASDGGVQVSVALDEAEMEAFAASFVVPNT